MTLPPLLVILGPTAVGKTEVAIETALRFDGEIISGDSMQVYRRMDIGTAKPTMEERRGVPHHLIDILEPDQTFSVADFQARVEALIPEIAARGKLPILAGGTGLYLRAVTTEYTFSEIETDWGLRHRLAAEADRLGEEPLHRRLAEVDPIAAARIHPNDRRRVIRALEVFYQTGQPISSLQTAEAGKSKWDLLQIGLTMDRESLYRRIEQRVDRMVEDGLVEEVRNLLGSGYSRDLFSMQSLGYREIAAYLEGEVPLEEAIALVKRNTRRFAKRQMTWFRRDKGIFWLELGEHMDKSRAVEEIAKMVEGKWGRPQNLLY